MFKKKKTPTTTYYKHKSVYTRTVFNRLWDMYFTEGRVYAAFITDRVTGTQKAASYANIRFGRDMKN